MSSNPAEIGLSSSESSDSEHTNQALHTSKTNKLQRLSDSSDISSAQQRKNKLTQLKLLLNKSKRENALLAKQEEGNKSNDEDNTISAHNKSSSRSNNSSDPSYFTQSILSAQQLYKSKEEKLSKQQQFNSNQLLSEHHGRVYEKKAKELEELAKERMKLNSYTNNLNDELLSNTNEAEDNLPAAFVSNNNEVSRVGLSRLSSSVLASKSKKAVFSRRRRFDAEETITYINEKNRNFNNRLDRAYGKVTKHIAEAVERGSAL
jgi:pre-mRNA-splicing factor SYF2